MSERLAGPQGTCVDREIAVKVGFTAPLPLRLSYKFALVTGRGY
ncbi:MAG TPA: hypothetical protein VFQ79_01365 [Bryobacteraceae bacterium]|nr:hypothetical protein [Bryobacteraceae bacterium]